MSLVTPSDNQTGITPPGPGFTSQSFESTTTSPNNNPGLSGDVITINKSDVSKIIGTIIATELALGAGLIAYHVYDKRKDKLAHKNGAPQDPVKIAR